MNKVFLKDCGIIAGEDVTTALRELFLKHPKDTEFVFENGEYYFSPHKEMFADLRLSNSDVMPHRVLGIWLQGMENCILSGNGAHLYFAGHMQPMTLEHCKNIKIKDFTVDWKKPLVAEGVTVGSGEDYIDLFVDPVLFPHRFTGDWLLFDTGADEWYPLWRSSQIQFDRNTRCVTRNSGDNFCPKRIEDLGGSVYRMFCDPGVETSEGNIFVLRHNARIHAGIFSEKCEGLTVEDVTFHSCGGLGCLAQFCRDLCFCRVHFLPNTSVGRRVSCGRDDGMHMTCNSGKITITECNFLGLMDDPINVHGCCVTADEVVDGRTLRCHYRHPQACGFHYWGEYGDEIVFIERGSMTPITTAELSRYDLEEMDTFTLTFREPLSEETLFLVREGVVAIDNLTHTAEFECKKNRFGSCRARSVLVSTPKPIRIEDNYFASSGSSILVAGDSNEWFESGECHDCLIKGNVFSDACLSSYYQFCEGVISICPVVPKPDVARPFHKNIRIEDNVFDSPSVPVLYGFSCDGLSFEGNRIFKNLSADRMHAGEHMIRLEYCRNTKVGGNDWVGGFNTSALISAENCK